MNKTFWNRFLDSSSDNRKSKTCTERRRSIQNLKWAGLFAIVVALTVCGARAEAQQAGKVYRIGYLQTSSREPLLHLTKAFKDGMQNLGYVEGRDITFEYRYADGKPERLPAFAAELPNKLMNPVAVASRSTFRLVQFVMFFLGAVYFSGCRAGPT